MPKVHILVTCPQGITPYSTLVFKTLRIGFPTASVKVWFNDFDEGGIEEIREICRIGHYEFEEDYTTHHGWIRKLSLMEKEPFWICDTDIIFYDSVEAYTSSCGICGWRIPEWKDEFTGCITRPRLHTSLMLINPSALQSEAEQFRKSFNEVPFIDPLADLFAPLVVPLDGRPYFYDVCSMLYNAIGGEEFPDVIKDRYFHFNFGTIENMVLPRLKDGEKMRVARQFVLDHPQVGMGAWRVQEEYYRNRQLNYDGKKIDDVMSQEDIEMAKLWNVELCCGNPDAMQFCDLYHRYVHGIDDLIDLMEDGRPTMSKEQIIGLFFQALVLYNSAFFVAYRHLLFPAIIQVTNMYQDSVAWERSPKSHLRKMADVMRTCGGEIYFMVALICGGPDHMRKMSQLIRERDFLSQHDEQGNPI